MRFLHTSDWHVGKVLKGVPRLEEHHRVLAGMVDLARSEGVDVVLVAGDLFESAVPSPDAQALVWSTLLGFRDAGSDVVVIGGNHDNGLQLEAIRPLARAAGITVIGRLARPEDGGVVTVERDGETARIATMPFVSQRHVVRAAELMKNDAADNAGTYADRCRIVLDRLCAAFEPTTINVVVAHAMVRGGTLGGGERDAQVVEDYYVDPTAFPASAHYVALGHLHRTQQLPGAAPIWYSGSPIQVDFGEEEQHKNVVLVDARPGAPATVRSVPLDGVRRLRTLTGTLHELSAQSGEVGDDLLRIVVDEQASAGLADRVRELFPNAIEIRLSLPEADRDSPTTSRQGLSPRELFQAFCDERNVHDERLASLFARLLDEATGVPE